MLFLLIHVNYNANSAIALLLVPPLTLQLLLLVNHNAKIGPQKEELIHPHDLNEKIIDLRSPQKTVSEIQEEQEFQEFQVIPRNEVFILAKYGTLMDLKSPPKTQYEIEDEKSTSELYI